MASQKKQSSQTFGLSGKVHVAIGEKLSEEFALRLSERFPHAVKRNVSFGSSFADVVLEIPGRVVVAEFKTGDPELPLPTSTIPQMDLFVKQARNLYPHREIVSFVFTNYNVSEPDKEALGKEGVKILNVASGSIDAIIADFLQQVQVSPQTKAETEA
jgi:hypothetical protein